MKVIQCPDCQRRTETEVTDGYVECRKCLQYVKMKDGTPVRAVPKDLIPTKIKESLRR